MIKRIVVNNQDIEYLEIGKGETLLFLHGAFGSFRFYKQLLEKLAKKYRVIAPVLPGMGQSQNIGEQDVNKITRYFLETLHEFIKQQIGDNKYLILGHSLGGYLGLRLITEFGNKPGKIIMINSPSHPLDHYYSQTLKGWLSVSTEHIKHLKEIGIVNLIPWDVFNMFFKRPRQFLKIIKALSRLEKIPQNEIHSSKLIILTSDDDYYIPKEHALNLVGSNPHALYHCITRGGHAWFQYNDKILLRILFNDNI